MAASSERPEATQVLLVDPHSLPVLLQGDAQGSGDAGDLSVDLLQRALQGAAGIQDGDGDESAEEVSLDALAASGVNSDNDVLAIYQGEGGQTHTIKISLAEAQSLGLQFSNDSYPESLGSGTLVAGMKTVDQRGAGGAISLNSAGLLQEVACSNVASEGRIIDTEGNIVETTEALQILPASLSSYLDDGLNHSLSIVQQYDLDGTLTYAVKLKDQSDTVLGPDYHIMEPDSTAKTGLDIEEELKSANLKQNILQASQTIPAGLTAAVSLNNDSNAIQVPISTLEALSKQILLPASSSSVPMSVTLTIPTETSVPSHAPIVSTSSLPTSNANRFYQIVTSRNSGINNVISSNASTPLTTLVPHQTLTVNQQQLNGSSTALLNVQNAAAVALLSNSRNMSNPISRIDKLPTLLPAPKGMTNSGLKTITALRKQAISSSIISPAVTATSSVHTPAMAAVAPVTTQPSLGSASNSKSILLNSRAPSSSTNSAKPLGSSENPIQLVQQGQTFHSMQALSQAQLRQIATVLQQKHLNSNSTETKNVLFDEQTKTRIVYRVVYPEDVDLQQPSSPTERIGAPGSQSGKNASRTKGRRGRPIRGRRTKQPAAERSTQKAERSNVPADSTPVPVDTDKEGEMKDDSVPVDETQKAERKKSSGSRTRSGRVIRPPKHMMKDFKRLHYTDFKERDGNESDGGYSDYSNPEQPVEKPPQKEVEIDPAPVKKKISRFSCPTCNKLYLGLGRMEKHFQQHPDHGCFEEFKQQLIASTPIASEETSGEKEVKASTSKANSAKGKKRSQGSSQSEKERSEVRKRKLKLALQACDLSEIMEVAGPLIARYSSLWDLLLLRLMAKDDKGFEKDISGDKTPNGKSTLDEPGNLGSSDKTSIPVESRTEDVRLRSTSNRVQWLLMELGSLADTLQSLAAELFQPVMIHSDEKDHIEITQKTVSGLLGVSCGTYSVNEEHLLKKMESVSANLKQKTDDTDVPPEKRSKNVNEALDISLDLNDTGAEVSSEDMSSLSLMVKPVDPEKTLLAKLADEDMPFLNSSDDMICGSEDPDLSTDSKRDQDAGLQVVDDIVNERLKNLSDNMNFAVPLQNGLNGEQSGLHLITGFSGVENSVSNSSVISNNLTENKPTVSVSNMGLISSYSMPSLSSTDPDTHNVNPEPSNDLALEPVTSQNMLGSFEIGLSSLSTFDALQSQSSNVSHSEDSFLVSLSSFETPLTQSCSSTSVPVSSFDDGVMKSNSMLQQESEIANSTRPPPKFISTFTPAATSDKTTSSISTAQRLQRSYLELDSGLDDGLDLDFEAFTQELGMNRNSSS